MAIGPLRTGELRHRVTIRQLIETPSQGGFDHAWQTFATPFAKVEGLDGREALIDQAMQGVSHFRVTIRWRGDVAARQQLRLSDGRELNIRSANDPDGRRIRLEILADTGEVERDP